jgi:hypothetical protein
VLRENNGIDFDPDVRYNSLRGDQQGKQIMNGWTNRATWLVNVWFSPESRDDVERARGVIEEAEDNLPDFLKDFLCTSEINWEELLSHFEDEEKEDEGECFPIWL